MATTRRRFTAEFKARVVVEALRGDRTIQEIGAKHHVHPNPGERLETASTGWSAGTVRGRRQPPAGGSRGDHPRVAREDRRVDGGADFLARGLKL